MTEALTATLDRHPRPRVGLASQSPRRHALLRELGLEPVPLAAGIDETRRPGELVASYVERLALEKARHGASDPLAAGLVVMGGDTVVCLGEAHYDKPEDAADARRMLRALSGREHTVMSAVAVVSGADEAVRRVDTTVRFRPLDDADIDRYVATGEPFGKAGAYAVQGLGGTLVSQLSGSYSAVVGLPVFETAELLRTCGIDIMAAAAGVAS